MLLKTKLHMPRPRKDVLPRPRLVDWLGANLDKPLLLVLAPAGYGKTTLLAQFTADAPLPIGWYQLDAGDNDPAAFLEYIVECIAGCCPEFGATTGALLESIQSIEVEWERLGVVLINEIIETVPEDILIVLEDYHLIDNPLIHAFVDRLLAQAPPQLHLLLSTRSDPLISLARLRARGQVAEMRGHDLRFTVEEARSLLNEVAQLDLPAERIQALVQETEGWAAALQLALTSLGRGPAPVLQTSLESLRGSNRHIFDYLSQEVLAAQPPEVQAFLLGSSILEQMSAALCNEVLGVEDSGQILETLEAGNLFIVPLDDQRQWYRYHHLFRDFLQEQQRREQGDEVGGLHRKALAYFAAAGDVERAIHHCQAAGETEKLAGLVEQAAPGYLRRGRLRTVQGWLEAVPEEVAAGRPRLALYRGMILAIWGQAREARLQLSEAQRAFAELDDELGESRALNQLGRVALFEGSYQESLELNHEALRKMPWIDHEGRVQALCDQCEVWLYLAHSRHRRGAGARPEAGRPCPASRGHHLGRQRLLSRRPAARGAADPEARSQDAGRSWCPGSPHRSLHDRAHPPGTLGAR
jgi:LuxR family maltose regulon positive regulatory protein